MNNTVKNIIPFHYVVTTAAAIAISGQAMATLQIEQDSDFELHQILGSSSLDVATDFMPNNFTVQITDQGTGRLLSNARVPQRCIAPYQGLRLLVPVKFYRGSVIQFDFLNTSAAATNTPTLCLYGLKYSNPI